VNTGAPWPDLDEAERRVHEMQSKLHQWASSDPARQFDDLFNLVYDPAFLVVAWNRVKTNKGRVRARIGDKRILGLVKAFLRAGVLTEAGLSRDTITGTPQGGLLSPCLANIALSILDEHFTRKWEELGPEWTRAKRRRAGTPTYRLVRYADDFVIMVGGTRTDAQALWDEVSTVLAPIGLRLSEEKTRVCHIDEGFDFLGFRIQRRSWRGRTGKRAVYTYPSKKALASVMDRVRRTTRRKRHRTLAELLRQLNRILRGWCSYFSHGVPSRTFNYLDHFAWWRVVGWLRKRHHGLN
jgi:RNA-directed DNA polymerase